MRPLRHTLLALVLSSTAALAAPAGSAPVAARAKLVKPALVSTTVIPAEVTRAQSHQLRPAHVLAAQSLPQLDGPSAITRRPPVLKPGPTPPRLNVAKFGELIHAAMKDDVRGYALGLRKNGTPILTLIWDRARSATEGGQGWTLDTRMHVASVSKLMTGIITAKLLDERGLEVDTPIEQYLPVYWNEAASSRQLTFRQLLTHSAGFTAHDGDFATFKNQIQTGVTPGSADALSYTNGTFSLIRVLASTMTGAVPRTTSFSLPGLSVTAQARLNDALWDLKTTDAFLAYAQSRVFTPSGITGIGMTPTAGSAYAYSGKQDQTGWNSGDLRTQLGGAGFRMSVNEVLSVMGTFRRGGKIIAAPKAQQALDARLGIDRITTTPAGKLYDKNGMWRTGSGPSHDVEQSVAYFFPEQMECVVLVNSWIGSQQASLRNTVRDAYLASLK